jgi:hypothetical protein
MNFQIILNMMKIDIGYGGENKMDLYMFEQIMEKLEEIR